MFPFRDARAAPDPVLEAGPVAHGPLPVPLVLDNGSFQARAGWACPGSDPGPEPRLQFRAVCARGRGGARGGAGPQVGNALGSLEPLRWMLRSPFDRNVPVNLELQELLLDYSFQHLGVSSQVKGGVGLGLRGGVRSCPRSLRSPRDNSHSSSSDCHLVIDLVSRSNIRCLTCVSPVLGAWGMAVSKNNALFSWSTYSGSFANTLIYYQICIEHLLCVRHFSRCLKYVRERDTKSPVFMERVWKVALV